MILMIQGILNVLKKKYLQLLNKQQNKPFKILDEEYQHETRAKINRKKQHQLYLYIEHLKK